MVIFNPTRWTVVFRGRTLGGIAQMARASGSYPEGRRFDPYSRYQLWAFSSAGRASALQAGCHRFEPYNAHHNLSETVWINRITGFSANSKGGFLQNFFIAGIKVSGKSFCIRRSFRACGPVVQLVRMPACHAGGRRFEPVPDRHFLLKIIDLVGVVKWLRPRVVAPVYVSSNLTIHPIRNFSIQLYMT